MVTTNIMQNDSPQPRARKRRCRVFINRLVSTVRDAARAWSTIYGFPCPQFAVVDHPNFTCDDYSRFVKEWLGSDLSEAPDAMMSFQSIKKLLPDSCKCMEEKMIRKLVDGLLSKPKDPPAGYLSFVQREVERLFPKGWDASYEKFCLGCFPPLSAVKGVSRSDGGCSGAYSGIRQDEFLSQVLHGERDAPNYYRGELIVVQSAGKPRPLSKFCSSSLLLKPLHKTIYDFISRFDWLLRGDVTPEKLKKSGFRASRGGELVSGDYKSATDNLILSVSQRILSTLLTKSCFVPEDIKGYAMESLTPILSSEYLEEDIQPAVGQMMGSYLSFPLLCLQNYLAFKWAKRQAGIREKLPLMINGDDILFQSPEGFYSRWVETVPKLGLEVEVVKTGVSRDWGSINSTLFKFDGEYLERVPTFRFGMLRQVNLVDNIGYSYHSFLAGHYDRRWQAAHVFFQYHLGSLKKFQYSLPSLGFRGRLALRMSRIYGLCYDRIDVVLPPKLHEMHLAPDLVTVLDLDEVSSEEIEQSAIEIAALKWNTGWLPVDREREGVRWAIQSTVRHEDDFAFLSRAFYADDQEFSFFVRQLRERKGDSRTVRAKRFEAGERKKKTIRLLSSVLAQIVPDFGRGDLPSYSEAVSTEGWYRVE